MTAAKWVGSGAAVALLAAALAGCTSAGGLKPMTPRATVPTAQWPTAGLYTNGQDATELTVPRGARTLHVDFSCTYGLYAVTPSAGMGSRSGTCGGAQEFDFDVASVAPGTKLRVEITVPADTRFVADLRFSPQQFSPIPTTRRECAALSSISEAYSNADQAVDHGDATASQWTDKTATAKGDLDKLAAAAKAGPGAGLLGPVIQEVNAWLSGAGNHPGGYVHAPLGDFTAAESLAGQICESNGTPITVHGAYGG